MLCRGLPLRSPLVAITKSLGGGSSQRLDVNTDKAVRRLRKWRKMLGALPPSMHGIRHKKANCCLSPITTFGLELGAASLTYNAFVLHRRWRSGLEGVSDAITQEGAAAGTEGHPGPAARPGMAAHLWRPIAAVAA